MYSIGLRATIVVFFSCFQENGSCLDRQKDDTRIPSFTSEIRNPKNFGNMCNITVSYQLSSQLYVSLSKITQSCNSEINKFYLGCVPSTLGRRGRLLAAPIGAPAQLHAALAGRSHTFLQLLLNLCNKHGAGRHPLIEAWKPLLSQS